MTNRPLATVVEFLGIDTNSWEFYPQSWEYLHRSPRWLHAAHTISQELDELLGILLKIMCIHRLGLCVYTVHDLCIHRSCVYTGSGLCVYTGSVYTHNSCVYTDLGCVYTQYMICVYTDPVYTHDLGYVYTQET